MPVTTASFSRLTSGLWPSVEHLGQAHRDECHGNSSIGARPTRAESYIPMPVPLPKADVLGGCAEQHDHLCVSIILFQIYAFSGGQPAHHVEDQHKEAPFLQQLLASASDGVIRVGSSHKVEEDDLCWCNFGSRCKVENA